MPLNTDHMRKSIQEWTKNILWKTAFKSLSSTTFTDSTLKYFVQYDHEFYLNLIKGFIFHA